MCSQFSFCWVAFCRSWTNNASFIPRAELWKKPRFGARPIWVWIQILPWTLGMELHLSEPVFSLEKKLGPKDHLPYRPGGRIKWENSYGVPDIAHEMKWNDHHHYSLWVSGRKVWKTSSSITQRDTTAQTRPNEHQLSICLWVQSSDEPSSVLPCFSVCKIFASNLPRLALSH